ncbi:MAG: hypothetical protein Q8L77_05590 [Nitrospirota bacterium]|nr:hypothetical protein [Nitrospirota bacterium]
MNLHDEHSSISNRLLGIVLCLLLSACSASPKTATTEERTVGQDRAAVENNGVQPPAGTTEGQAAVTRPGARCTTQLKQGYALRERIDKEYWQSRRAGTFRDQRDAFIARWEKEAGKWAAETKTVLLHIGGPAARDRFQNAQTPIGMVSGDVQWNNIRNYLRTRLAALDSICKMP